MRARLALPTLLFVWLLTSVASAQDLEVDVELVIAVDVSRSMTPRELEIQRRGYAEALVSDEVVSAIQKGMLGRVARKSTCPSLHKPSMQRLSGRG